jgi:hypothetical protein
MELIQPMSNNKKLPFDEGRGAYLERISPYSNPYSSDKWENHEWWLGWSHEEEVDIDENYDHVSDVFKNNETKR